MKKTLAFLLALVMILSLAACGKKDNDPAVDPSPAPDTGEPAATPDDTPAPGGDGVEPDYSYPIRIYSNSNSTERTTWLIAEAKDAGFNISIDDQAVISGDTAAIQAANENKDGDLIFGLNETRWSQLVDGTYENLRIMDWTPTWSGDVGEYVYPGKAYGLVIQNVLMLYRNDELGTNGEELHFDHWADIVNCGYSWYRQNKVGGTTNANINSAMLYAFVDPASPAGVSKRAVKENQKGKRGQKSLDVWNDSGAFETRSGYRPIRKQLRHLEDFPAFAENTCCGVPE